MKPPDDARILAADWRRALPALVILLGTILLAYRDTALAMVSIWSRSDTFTHAFLVPPIVAWLIWQQRRRVAAVRPQPSPWVLLAMAAVALAWLLGDLAAANALTQLALTALLVLAVPAVLGVQVARLVAFPLGFLFFAVPIGEFLLPQLMSWTADFTVLALRACGIPVFREGMQIVIPSGHWSVVEACSGVRYLIASFMVGTLYAYLNYRSRRRRLAFAAIAIAVPIVANWIRAFLIVLLGHVSNNTLAAGIDHLIYGWAFFGIVIGLMYAIGAVWSESDATTPPTSEGLAASSPGARPPMLWGTALAGIALVLVPHLVLLTVGDMAPGATPELAALSAPSGGWQRNDGAVVAWKPAYREPSAEVNAGYCLNGQGVGLYVAYYRQQNYRRKLVSSDNELVKSSDRAWMRLGPIGHDTVQVDGTAMSVRSALLKGSAEDPAVERRLRVWQLYWVGGRLTASEPRARVFAAIDRLRGRGDDAAAIVVYAEEDDRAPARPLLGTFLQSNLAAIVTQLQKNRKSAQTSVAAFDAKVVR